MSGICRFFPAARMHQKGWCITIAIFNLLLLFSFSFFWCCRLSPVPKEHACIYACICRLCIRKRDMRVCVNIWNCREVYVTQCKMWTCVMNSSTTLRTATLPLLASLWLSNLIQLPNKSHEVSRKTPCNKEIEPKAQCRHNRFRVTTLQLPNPPLFSRLSQSTSVSGMK